MPRSIHYTTRGRKTSGGAWWTQCEYYSSTIDYSWLIIMYIGSRQASIRYVYLLLYLTSSYYACKHVLPWQFYLWWKWLVTFPWHVTPSHEVGLCVLISNQYITCLKKHLNHALKLKWTRWARGGLVDSQTLSLRWRLAPALSSASVVAESPLSAEKWRADKPVHCGWESNSIKGLVRINGWDFLRVWRLLLHCLLDSWWMWPSYYVTPAIAHA